MPAETVLVLGGTSEAAALAGRTASPARGPGETRVGGFGGWRGLADFLRAERVTRLVDATHPFAQRISGNAAQAARAAGVSRIALLRPPWEPVAADRWRAVDGLDAARDALPANARAFLALGRQHLAPFASRADVAFTVRMVDPPAEPLFFPAELVIGKPPDRWEEEAALFRRLGVTHLVSRNSGGSASYAKIEAARRLGLFVVMIRRTGVPEPPLARDVEAVMAWLDA